MIFIVFLMDYPIKCISKGYFKGFIAFYKQRKAVF